MKNLPTLVFHCAFAWLALSIAPLYEVLLADLFDRVQEGLQTALLQVRA